jgi:electron transport complex protein RnfG
MTAPAAIERTPAVALLRTLGVVAMVCGVIIVASYELTLPAVTENKRIALERAVLRVLPGAAAAVPMLAGADGVAPAPGAETPAGALRFYAAYDGEGKLRGLAAEGAARGYADLVRILWGYDPQRQAVIGFSVVQTRETPGIGDKVSVDRDFLANFEALDVRLAPDGGGLAHPVRTVKHGAKTQPWEIDAITGATVTSKAVGKAINDSAQALLPRVVPHLEKIGSRP